MLNPRYLIKSRHDIFYFRYPVGNGRVCVSLKTRCPNEALKLAKLLEYHSAALIKGMDLKRMNHAEIMVMLKNYYAEVLERVKERMDKDGSLPKQNILNLEDSLKQWNEIIVADVDDVPELVGAEYEDPDDDELKKDLQKIMAKNGVSFATDSKEYAMMKAAYKHVKRNYLKDLLAYNSSITDFSLLETTTGATPITKAKSNHKLGKVMDEYLKEIQSSLTDRSYNEQRDCLNYLIDWLGVD